MASGGKVSFKWSRAGYAALMDEPGVQAVVQRVADDIADKATSMLDPDEGYDLDDFEVREARGQLARQRIVRTKTDHARYSQAKNKTLTKALKAAKAG